MERGPVAGGAGGGGRGADGLGHLAGPHLAVGRPLGVRGDGAAAQHHPAQRRPAARGHLHRGQRPGLVRGGAGHLARAPGGGSRQPGIPAALHAAPEHDLHDPPGSAAGGPHRLGLVQPGLGRHPDPHRGHHPGEPGGGRGLAMGAPPSGAGVENPAPGPDRAGHLVPVRGLGHLPPLPAQPGAGHGTLRLPQRGPGAQGPGPHPGRPEPGSPGRDPRKAPAARQAQRRGEASARIKP